MCRYESRMISKRCNEIQVRCKHYITLCACILFLQNLAHKYSSFQWSFVYKTKSLQVVFQIGEDTLPPIPPTLPVKDRKKDGMFWSKCNLPPKDSRSSQINFLHWYYCAGFESCTFWPATQLPFSHCESRQPEAAWNPKELLRGHRWTAFLSRVVARFHCLWILLQQKHSLTWHGEHCT